MIKGLLYMELKVNLIHTGKMKGCIHATWYLCGLKIAPKIFHDSVWKNKKIKKNCVSILPEYFLIVFAFHC